MTAADLDTFIALPRLSDLVMAPDGRLVVEVARPGRGGRAYRSSLWEVDPAGGRPARRLTRSGNGESYPTFAGDGSLLFASRRPHPDAAELDDAGPGLWCLPPHAGEPRLLAEPAAGVEAIATAADAPRAVIAAAVHPGSKDFDEDRARQEAREDAGVTAHLVSSYPMRWWDRILGARETHLWLVDLGGSDDRGTSERDLTPDAARALVDPSFDLTPDGRTLVTTWAASSEQGGWAVDLVAVDIASGSRRVLAGGGYWHRDVACSPDGLAVACVREYQGAPGDPPYAELVVIDLDSGRQQVLDVGDRWISSPRWSPSGTAILVTADEQGHHPVYRLDLATGEPTRVTGDGAFVDPWESPDGEVLYALRSHVTTPWHPVRIRLDDRSEPPLPLPAPIGPRDRGRCERLTARADDEVEIGAWLVLPDGAPPPGGHPLVVAIHGGPHTSWAGWHWRWNPVVLAGRGYAVLLPDPGLSTGYGPAFLARGWGAWAERPFADVLTALDAAVQREDVDGDRVAAVGASFGGYLTNWAAGHTDRFRAIVSHASIWDLETVHGTTDIAPPLVREFGDPYRDPEHYRAQSPRSSVGSIRTPMLVIHGARDQRVPISEAIRQWTDLHHHGVEARFLYFPDEHHLVQRLPHVRLFYETLLAFLDHHVLGADWCPPDLL